MSVPLNNSLPPSKPFWLIKRIFRLVSICFILLVVFFVYSLWPMWWPVSPAGELSKLPLGKAFDGTRFEFRYGNATRIIEDPENHLRVVYGEMPDSIIIENGTRVIIYEEPKSIIKSQNDSIQVLNDEVKYRGHLGISSSKTHFVVDENGYLVALDRYVK